VKPIDVKFNDHPKIFENEDILPDDYYVYASYAYVVDGMMIVSPIEGNVKRLRVVLAEHSAEGAPLEIRRCNIFARRADWEERCKEQGISSF
jgi:hypothetical protein